MIRGGRTCLLILHDSSVDSVILRLNNTRSWLRVFGALSRKSTIKYRLVSSTKRRIVDLISFTSKNKSGPSIEPQGTPAIMITLLDVPPGKATLCL